MRRSLKAADSGPDGKGEKVVIKRVAIKDGRPVPDPANSNRPTLVDAERRKTAEEPRGEPLYCYDWYVKELARLTDRNRRMPRSSSRSWRRKRKR